MRVDLSATEVKFRRHQLAAALKFICTNVFCLPVIIKQLRPELKYVETNEIELLCHVTH